MTNRAGMPPTLKASDAVTAEVTRRVKAPHRPVLVVLSGNEVGQRVLVDRTLSVGRDPGADLTLTDGLVSFSHARLEDRGDTWTLIDLGSTNGTSVNGEVLPEFDLKPNDKIVFGSTVVRFELQGGAEQAYNAAVERLLNIDDLSGLYMRRKFDAELERMIASGQPVCLLVMDLDGIKKINDTHGHLFGAYVIGESGRLIGQVIGSRGIGSRFGGDEYLAALPGVGLEAGEGVANEILKAINEYPYERDGIPLRPGVSIGIAACPESATDAHSLFQCADEAMYRAKQGGKNRVAR